MSNQWLGDQLVAFHYFLWDKIYPCKFWQTGKKKKGGGGAGRSVSSQNPPSAGGSLDKHLSVLSPQKSYA